jgi:hypothetical protein
MRGKPASGIQHPEVWRLDLNPEAEAGENIGPTGRQPEADAHTAYDIKDLHRQLRELQDDELKRIPVLPVGTRLEQGATYIDLRDPGRGEFTATGDMRAEPGAFYVRKDSVDYQLWNRLRGVRNPERLGEAPEGATRRR